VTQRRPHRYELKLAQNLGDLRPGPTERNPNKTDLEALATLMIDAYQGTIDYDGESLSDAHREVANYFAATPLLDHSWIDHRSKLIRSACLASYLPVEKAPLIAYIMTSGTSWAWRGGC
jgi:hypothetical protein